MANENSGIVTPHKDVLVTVNEVATNVAVILTKLEFYIQRDKERKEEVEAMRGELGDLKVKVYTMAGVFSIIVSVATSWITNQLS